MSLDYDRSGLTCYQMEDVLGSTFNRKMRFSHADYKIELNVDKLAPLNRSYSIKFVSYCAEVLT